MKSNNFGYLLKEGVRGIFLHGFMSFAAVCVTVACLIIIGSFSMLLYNLNIMVAEVEQDAGHHATPQRTWLDEKELRSPLWMSIGQTMAKLPSGDRI